MRNQEKAVANKLLQHKEAQNYLLQGIQYTNNLGLLSDPEASSNFIIAMMIEKITRVMGDKAKTYLAAVSETGLLVAKKCAEKMESSSFIDMNTHDLKEIKANSNILLIEDVLHNNYCCDASITLRNLGHQVHDIIAIYTSQNNVINKSCEKVSLTVHALTNKRTLINLALKQKIINDTQYHEVSRSMSNSG